MVPSQVSQAFNTQSGTEIVNPIGFPPTQIKGRTSGWSDPQNLSTVTQDISKIQGALRQAERGDTYQLFTLYRDWTLNSTHIQGELNKRKMVVSGQPYSLQPADKDNPEDVKACDYIKDMIEDCENWDVAMGQLMDAAIWPISVMEKIFDTSPDNTGRKRPIRIGLKKLVAVQPVLFCYKIPYLAPGGNGFQPVSRSQCNPDFKRGCGAPSGRHDFQRGRLGGRFAVLLDVRQRNG